MRLGIDSYSLRFQGWDAFAYLKYAAEIGVDGVQFSTPSTIVSYDDDYLARMRRYADERSLYIELGIGSIDQYSATFRTGNETAEEQLSAMLRAAPKVGSPVVRCFLGSGADRRGTVPLKQHMEECVRVLRAVAPLARSLGVKVAIENHAGDLQARELAWIIEEAGPDAVGACVDTGNPVWTVEDPLLTVEVLAPYACSTHVRDSRVWKSERGAFVQWVPMGTGNVRIDQVVGVLRDRCPNVAINLEVITELGPRELDYLDPAFWEVYPATAASDFARFLALAERGTPADFEYVQAPRGESPSPELAEQLRMQQLRHFEQSVDYARKVLGLGERQKGR